jgi:hypothetical protein
VAALLVGKHKPTCTPHVDGADHVVVLNAAAVALTGKKPTAKLYRWHTGGMGGLKTLTARQVMERDPARVAHLLAEGAAELATMDSYHAVRDAKERAQRNEGEVAVAAAAAAGLGDEGPGRGGGGAAPSPPLAPADAGLPPAAAAASAAPPADAVRLIDALGAALGAMDERAIGGAAAQRALQALSLHIDGAAAALARARPGAALRDAQAAQRELQALVLLLRDAAGIAGGESAAAQLAALAPLSLGLRRVLWALREAPLA